MKTFEEFLIEGARIKRIRFRIRNGKIQRNKRVSGVKGFSLRHGRLVRMSSTEKLHRKRGARRAKIKRRAEKQRSLIKRRRSLRKRKSMGF